MTAEARAPRSPFAPTAPSIVAALAYAAAAVVWVAAGGDLPGGRWLAVHLFTLGVLTNVVLAFSAHFARTVTRSREAPVRWHTPVVNVGILAVLVGVSTGTPWAVVTGAVGVTAVVVASYRRLRRMRKDALGARFAWIVRIYERAHGAFVQGAVLGALLGAGVLSGAWYGAARLAHLHVNVLGWGGLTLLATLVFFGPTIVRTRIVAGADERAARALRRGATGLTVGVLLLLATGAGGGAGTVLRIAAAAGIAVFAWSATVTCLPVAAAAGRAKPSATRWPVVAVGLWFPVAAWADTAVVAAGAWQYLPVLGSAVLLGVLVQTIATVLTYLTPLLCGRGFAGRDRLLARFERGAGARTVGYNAGVLALVAAGVVGGAPGAVLARAGWGLVIVALVSLAVAAAAPGRPPSEEAAGPVSQVARRYRNDQG